MSQRLGRESVGKQCQLSTGRRITTIQPGNLRWLPFRMRMTGPTPHSSSLVKHPHGNRLLTLHKGKARNQERMRRAGATLQREYDMPIRTRRRAQCRDRAYFKRPSGREKEERRPASLQSAFHSSFLSKSSGTSIPDGLSVCLSDDGQRSVKADPTHSKRVAIDSIGQSLDIQRPAVPKHATVECVDREGIER